ncbi:MAG: universal stress protein [Cyclobacteriaceae bacterium]
MKKNAILATDLSNAADVLLECKKQYKALGIEKITLFHALGVQYMNFSGYTFLDQTKARLEKIKNKLEKDGFLVEIVIKEGLPYYELVDFGKENPDAILILGTRGMGFLKGVLLGSTADQVIRRSKNPILLIQCIESESNGKDEQNKFYCNHSYDKLLFATDFSDCSEQAFQFLKNNVVQSTDKIILTHILDSEKNEGRSQEEIDKLDLIHKERLLRMKNDLLSLTDSDIEIVLRSGLPIKEIVNLIKQKNVNLVLMGAHGKGFIEDRILGSTIRSVVELSKVNHLIIPFNH